MSGLLERVNPALYAKHCAPRPKPVPAVEKPADPPWRKRLTGRDETGRAA